MNRQGNIIWFNPPFKKIVKTNVAKIFFYLLDKYFPRTNRLYKIFNRNAFKVIIIKKRNNYISRKKPKSTPSCNCRKKDDYPTDGNFLINNVIYKCTVSPTTTTKQRAYLGLAEVGWKQRYYNYTQPFKQKSDFSACNNFCGHCSDHAN